MASLKQLLIFVIAMKTTMYRIYTFFLFLFTCTALYSQETDTVKIKANEILVQKDTVYFGLQDSVILIPHGEAYKISKNFLVPENVEGKSKTANYLYKQYVQLWRSQMVSQKAPETFEKSDDNFEPFSDKIIRNITLLQVPVMEGSVYDTVKVNVSDFGKFWDRIHIDTRPWVLRNNLKFASGDVLDPGELADNERLLRGLPFMEDAKIYVHQTSLLSDSVDLVVVTKDNIPMGLDGEVRDVDYYVLGPYTQNFLGVGHRASGKIQYNGGYDPLWGYGAGYAVNNAFGLFVNTSLALSRTYQSEYLQYKAEKDFLTRQTRLGGAFTYENLKTSEGYTLNTPDSIYTVVDTFRHSVLGVWAGVSLFPGNKASSLLVNVAGNYEKKLYLERPEIRLDTNFRFHDHENYLLAFTLRKTAYVNTTKLLGFGVVEDIPTGLNLQVITGIQETYYFHRSYLGMRAEMAGLRAGGGIHSLKLASGAYDNGGKAEDVVLGIRYFNFSKLYKVGALQLRSVFSTSYTSLISPHYTSNLNFGNQVRGLNQYGIYGNSSFTLRYQPVFFTHFYWLGFRLSFYPYCDLGWISLSEHFRGKKDFYGAYGVSWSFKNESFTFPALNFNVGYYPLLAEQGSHFVFKVQLKDFTLGDLFSSFKPDPVEVLEFY